MVGVEEPLLSAHLDGEVVLELSWRQVVCTTYGVGLVVDKKVLDIDAFILALECVEFFEPVEPSKICGIEPVVIFVVVVAAVVLLLAFVLDALFLLESVGYKQADGRERRKSRSFSLV